MHRKISEFLMLHLHQILCICIVKQGTAKVERPVKTNPKPLTEDTGVQLADLPNAVDNSAMEGNSQFDPGYLPDMTMMMIYYLFCIG